MIVAVQASGRMVMLIGPLVFEPADQLVVVDDALNVGVVDAVGQFGGVVGVDDDHRLRRRRHSAMIAGLGRSQRCSMNAASVLGSPSSTASAFWPLTSFRYQAQMIGRAGGIGVGGFVAENLDGHVGVRAWGCEFRGLYRGVRRGCHPPAMGDFACVVFADNRVGGRYQGCMAGIRETDLYPPVKAFLQAQGYEVKAEIAEADVVGVRGDEPPVIVELKTGFSLSLVHQGDRAAVDHRCGLPGGAAQDRAGGGAVSEG